MSISWKISTKGFSLSKIKSQNPHGFWDCIWRKALYSLSHHRHGHKYRRKPPGAGNLQYQAVDTAHRSVDRCLPASSLLFPRWRRSVLYEPDCSTEQILSSFTSSFLPFFDVVSRLLFVCGLFATSSSLPVNKHGIIMVMILYRFVVFALTSFVILNASWPIYDILVRINQKTSNITNINIDSTRDALTR